MEEKRQLSGEVAPPPTYKEASTNQQQSQQAHIASSPAPPGLGTVGMGAPSGQWPQAAPTFVHVQAAFGPHPQRVICPICSADVITMSEHKSGIFSYLMGSFLCLIGCWPCCVLPCLIDSCMDVEHRCPSCMHIIGISKRLN